MREGTPTMIGGVRPHLSLATVRDWSPGSAPQVLLSGSGHQTREQILRADLQSEGGSKRSGHERRGAERSQVDEPDAMLIIGNQLLCRREGHGGLADSPRPNDGEKALPGQPRREGADNIGTTYQTGDWSRQIVHPLRCGCVQSRRNRFLQDLDRRDEAIASAWNIDQITIAAMTVAQHTA